MSSHPRGAAAPPSLPVVLGAGVHTNAPRLALRKSDAAAAIGVSDETFDAHVRPTLPVVRLGSVRVYPVDELVAWLAANALSPADDLEARS